MADFKLKKMDQQPPKLTGNPSTDVAKLSEFCSQLIETINYNYYLLEKEIKE